MKGLVYTGEKAELTDGLAVRDPGPNEVLVQVVAAGLCHSDLSVIDGTIPWPAPAVLGHEGAGIVEAVGEAVSHVAPGDHIVMHTMASCGVCKWCSSGRPAWCRYSMGNMSQPFTLDGEPAWNFAGASFFSERSVVAATQCVKIPPDVPLESACLIGCGVLTGVGSVWNRTQLGVGDTAAVFGVGGVGLNVIQAAAIKGASRVIAVDTMPEKERWAREFGASDFFVTGPDVDIVGKIRELLPPDPPHAVMNAGGVDYAFDCVGHPDVLNACLEMLDWGGTAVIIGVPAPSATVPARIGNFTHVERTLTGSRAGSHRPHYDIPLVVDLYRRGVLKLDELVTARYPLSDWETAVHDLHDGKLARGVLEIS
ncbi:MAG: alcohol dehydrogenase catalytic domain-containing protein [Acidimicrobiia bacterium]